MKLPVRPAARRPIWWRVWNRVQYTIPISFSVQDIFSIARNRWLINATTFVLRAIAGCSKTDKWTCQISHPTSRDRHIRHSVAPETASCSYYSISYVHFRHFLEPQSRVEPTSSPIFCWWHKDKHRIMGALKRMTNVMMTLSCLMSFYICGSRASIFSGQSSINLLEEHMKAADEMKHLRNFEEYPRNNRKILDSHSDSLSTNMEQQGNVRRYLQVNSSIRSRHNFVWWDADTTFHSHKPPLYFQSTMLCK
jgi:hypothetical protein